MFPDNWTLTPDDRTMTTTASSHKT